MSWMINHLQHSIPFRKASFSWMFLSKHSGWYCDAYAGVDARYYFFNTSSFYDILISQWVWLILLGNNLSLTLIQMVDHL